MNGFKDSWDNALKECRGTAVALLKWIVLSVVIGISVGVISAAFSKLLMLATDLRMAHKWIVFGLPLGGLVIVFLYKIWNEEKNVGTNLVLEVVRDDEDFVPGRVAPLILISSIITHFFGGSAGREGAALQFGASIGDWFGRKIHLNESDRKIITLASMSAAFAGLLGTPMAAALFPIEVVSVGVMYYSALVPCVFSAFISQEVCLFLNVRKLTSPYPVTSAPVFYSMASIKAVAMAICFALAGLLFCFVMHRAHDLYEKYLGNLYLRAAAGGVIVILLYLIVGTDDYLGLGVDVIKESFDAPASWAAFGLKIIFTALTLGAGYKGGEIVPSLFIGATLGSALSVVLGMPVSLCAACGMVGVFCAVTNCPIASFIIAFELFGGKGMPFYCIVIAVSYLMSGYSSLYREQRIVYSKTENRYINTKAR